MKAWDTVVVKADAGTESYVDKGGEAPVKVVTPHPHAGRAGVVRAVDEAGGTVSVTLDQVGDKPQVDATVKIADCTFHTVNA